ncbi:protein RRP6-like 2 [Quillaja saponaria]|uniref:Protein RRP6-like 2 n=1 Tax=Quillaja saponaria TaxID=32244 RepID=A0AAD7VDS6_QUISA|nr:protein RRP6-like 2 [Quillaja saponaria]
MNKDAINMDQSQAANSAQTLQSLASGPSSSSVAKLSGSSRCIPSDKDFHFYYNFDEFKNPIQEITKKSQSMLETIGTSAHGWGKEMPFTEDVYDAYDWLVNVNDELFERFDVSVEEFQTIRRKEGETEKPISTLQDSENGFQLVYGI